MKRLFFVVILASQPTFATEYKWNDECDNNQRTMTNCSIGKFKFYDEQLNSAYKNTINNLPIEKQQQLRIEQRAWLNDRDPDCRDDADDIAKGGSMWSMIYNGCRADSTAERTRMINQWLSQ